MNGLAFVIAIAAVILFGIYAYTAVVKFLGFGLLATVVAWCVQLIWRAFQLHVP